MAKKNTTSIKPTSAKPKQSGFLANLTKRTGVAVVPISELLANMKTTYTDTGSYVLNALISGSIYGGLPSDTIVGLAGEKATGKTYVCISVCKHFLEANPTGIVFYFDTEGAIKPNMVIDRGLPEDRFQLKKVSTLEQFRMEAVRIVNDYMSYPEEERPPMIMVLDSLGNISTVKEMEEAAQDIDKQKKDMTKAQLIRSVFRVLSIKLEEANIPLLVTNHVGVKIGARVRAGMPPPVEMSGGEGLKFAASTILILTKSGIYDEKNKTYTGVRMKAALYKSRHTVEKMQAETKLDYATGMDRYYGLIEFAKKFGLTEKSGNGQKFTIGEDPKQFFESSLLAEPQVYFTKEVLDAIEEKVKQTFPYGKSSPMSLLRDEFDENDATAFAIDAVEPVAEAPAAEAVPASDTDIVKAALTKKKAKK
jgi:RecA/RadA recombinase